MNIRQKSVNQHEELRFGETYHIFNRAISNDKLFTSDKDYFYFLQKLDHFLLPWIDVIAYCLIPNHFHLLANIKEIDKIPVKLLKQGGNEPEKLISNAFLSNKPSKVNKEYVLNLFGSKKDFISFHKENITKRGLKDYILE